MDEGTGCIWLPQADAVPQRYMTVVVVTVTDKSDHGNSHKWRHGVRIYSIYLPI